MLAQLLRRLLYTQLLVGTALGYYLGGAEAALLLALALPVATVWIGGLVSSLLARGTSPWGLWLHALMGEMRAGLLFFLLRQPWAGTPPSYLPATGGPARLPVLLVHGYVCNHRIWDELVGQLRAQGHPVVMVDLEPVFASIDDYAPILETAATALLRESGQSQLTLVGHSMGGLAIRAWLRQHGTARVARVLTLGTPHVGTQIAKTAPTPNGRQMQWQSPWLQALAKSEDDALRRLFRIGIAPQDNIVFPQQAQILRGVQPQLFPGIGHLQMCLDPDVQHWVLQQLAEASLPPPPPEPA
ncbi:alpha/beta fold hydrolase [uncultured Rhodoferax sp.]|uniref:esterase/lipase family protein n=1 Tax=uncultured Rhodoferax sp. TaxID=223188 RepID=UPI0025EE0F97|nr:alpha/beta fold hydrolase [uncultured Rhodoferax sp.]